jgi:GTP:adenosylcobinamide-phosphate guanylyltransferase
MVLISHHVPRTEKNQNEKRLHYQQKQTKTYWADLNYYVLFI